MWTRKELKQRAKEALGRNYWKIVLVTALAVLLGGGSGYSYGRAGTAGTRTVDDDRTKVIVAEYDEEMPGEDAEYVEDFTVSTADEGISPTGRLTMGEIAEALDAAAQEMSDLQIIVFGISMAAIFMIVVLFIMAFSYALMAFLYNPFYTGVCRFMLKSVDDKSEVKEVAYGFDHSYKNVVKTMFQSDIRIFGWALLFFIPGIYKKYQYRMVPYILAEHPDTPYREALRMSSDIMNGEKWHAFVLDLSFIPWHLLGLITCGIVELFYVSPYVYLTHAALYRRLCGLRTDDRQLTLGEVEGQNGL